MWEIYFVASFKLNYKEEHFNLVSTQFKQVSAIWCYEL